MTKKSVELSRATVSIGRAAKSGATIFILFFLNVVSLQSQTADALLDKLIQKGILTEKEAEELRAESAPRMTNAPDASKWSLGTSIKKVELYGDLRFRYEYRAAENAPNSGEPLDNSAYMRERFRYAARLGLRGALYDDFYWGIRLDTATNPRSPWVTFGDDSNPSPFAKNSDTIGIGQVFIGWRPDNACYEVLFGKMPQPLYTTTMVWDSDYNPEGAFEKFKYSIGPADLFVDFGQFVYQDTNPDVGLFSSDTFLLTFQAGAHMKFSENVSAKIAPVFYAYAGRGATNGLNRTFTGQGFVGLNTNGAAFNNSGINDLAILEVPAEVNLKLGRYNTRLFADVAYNFQGAERADRAAAAAELDRSYRGENKAAMAGISFGTSQAGLTLNTVSKKNTWEARVFWQHVEQYALDVNLLDSDFFEGRGNLEGYYFGLAYCFTDSILATFRYGYASRINHNLDTGGTNPDLPVLNPVRNFHILQLDLSYRF